MRSKPHNVCVGRVARRMVHGALQDPYAEFFIQPGPGADAGAAGAPAGGTGTAGDASTGASAGRGEGGSGPQEWESSVVVGELDLEL